MNTPDPIVTLAESILPSAEGVAGGVVGGTVVSSCLSQPTTITAPTSATCIHRFIMSVSFSIRV